jgi:hypothetical protein
MCRWTWGFAVLHRILLSIVYEPILLKVWEAKSRLRSTSHNVKGLLEEGSAHVLGQQIFEFSIHTPLMVFSVFLVGPPLAVWMMLWCNLLAWCISATVGEDGYTCSLYINSCITLSLFQMLLLQEEFDTHDPKAHHFLKLPFLKKRSRIVEIGAARDTVFALTHSGICAAFSRGAALNPSCFITNLMGHVVVDCYSDLQAGFECTRHKQENMFPQHQCRWSDSKFVLQQEQWFLDHCISICFWQLQLLEVQNHSYWVCFLLYTIFDCIHIIKFGLSYTLLKALSYWSCF